MFFYVLNYMSKITAFGTYVPEKIIDNHYFQNIIETTDDWITSRTGVKTRRYSKEGELTSDLAIKAVQNLIETSGKIVKDVDYLIICTTSPDFLMPNVASVVQHKLGILNTGCNDIYAACAGFVYGLQLAHSLVNANLYKKILVIGSETLSKITNFKDRNSCILFGDGAGAVLIEPSPQEQFIAFDSGTSGEFGSDLYLSHTEKIIHGVRVNPNKKINQNGRVVFKWVVGNIPTKIKKLLKKAGMELKDMDYIVSHSANLRIIEAISKELQYPMDKMPQSVTEFGNTSSASIPLAMEKSMKNGGIKKGDTILLIGFGGGLTYASCILKWGI